MRRKKEIALTSIGRNVDEQNTKKLAGTYPVTLSRCVVLWLLPSIWEREKARKDVFPHARCVHAALRPLNHRDVYTRIVSDSS